MIVSSFSINDPKIALSHAIHDESRVRVLDNQPCEIQVDIDKAFIDFHSTYGDAPHRPYLHMIGTCNALACDLPYGVNGLRYTPSRSAGVEIFYDFDDESLADLVRKGLYGKTFTCPDVLYDNTLIFPANCNVLMIQPQYDTLPPIVFSGIQNQYNMEFTMDTCGYDFAQFFEKAPEEHYDFEEDNQITADNYVSVNNALQFETKQDKHEEQDNKPAESTVQHDDRPLDEETREIQEQISKTLDSMPDVSTRTVTHTLLVSTNNNTGDTLSVMNTTNVQPDVQDDEPAYITSDLFQQDEEDAEQPDDNWQDSDVEQYDDEDSKAEKQRKRVVNEQARRNAAENNEHYEREDTVRRERYTIPTDLLEMTNSINSENTEDHDFE